MFSGYAFAAIKGTKDDPIPNPGPGPNPNPTPKPEPDPEVEATYSISGQGPVYPYTPFTVTVTASDGKTAGRHGNLSGMFSDNTQLSYRVLSQSGWSSGTKTHSLGVETIDRSKSGVTFLWLQNGKDSPRATLAYSAAHMVPNIVPETVKAGTAFTYKVTYSSSTSGSAISTSYGTWANFGASVKWQGYDGTKWEDVDIVSASSPSGGSGVFSGTATCAMSMKYSKIRLCVTYAGETLYDEASFANADALVITGVSTLHRYGDADELSITGADITPDNVGSVVIKAFNVLGEEVDIDDYFEDEDGDFLDFTEGWEAQTGGGMKWIGSIRAVSDVDQNREITLKALFLGSVATHDILIVAEVGGEIDADSSVVQHVQFPISMWIAGGVNRNLAIPRFPTESLSLDGGNDFTGASLTWSYDASTGKCVCATQGTFTSTGDKELKLVDLSSNVYATAEVAVVSIALALAEAINERILAKTGTAGTYTDQDTASTLRSGAISAANDYVNGDVAADGTYTAYSSQSPLQLDASEETPQWYADAYDAVCHVNEMPVDRNGNMVFESVRYDYFGEGVVADIDIDEGDDYADYRRKMLNVARRNFTKTNTTSGTESELKATLSFDGDDHSHARIIGHTFKHRFAFTGNAYFSCRAYCNGVSYKYNNDYTFDTFNSNVPSQIDGRRRVYADVSAGGTSSYSEWIGEVTDFNIDRYVDVGGGGSWYYDYGFKFGYTGKMFLDYNFKHKK